MSAWNKGKRLYNDNEIFCKNSDISQYQLRKYYSEQKEINYKCSICGIDEWLDKKINLELDHKNGNNRDNRKDNLRWLCSNCHSQTPTFKGYNNSGKKKIEDNEIIETIKNSSNVREVLLKVGLRARGGNYDRIYRLMIKYSLSFPEKQNHCIDCDISIWSGAKRCKKCDTINRRKVKRPSKEQLLKEIKELGYCGTGRKYGVSDNAIRKWIK